MSVCVRVCVSEGFYTVRDLEGVRVCLREFFTRLEDVGACVLEGLYTV